jgi:uncharacterized repeat protein (TIGR01451 family)
MVFVCILAVFLGTTALAETPPGSVSDLEGEARSAAESEGTPDGVYVQLCLNKTDDVDGCVFPGELVTYTITYSNPGELPVHDVVMVDYLPPEVDFESATGGGVFAGGDPETVTWDLGTIPGWSNGVETLVVRVKEGVEAGAVMVDSCVIDGFESVPKMVVETTRVCLCVIQGEIEVCPSSVNQYCGPEGMHSYSWSVTGDGTVVGPAGNRCVEVQAGSDCHGTFDVHLTVVDQEGVESSCSLTVTFHDEQDPTIVSCPGNETVECRSEVPQPDVGLVEADDDCGNVTVTWEGDQSDGNTCPEVITRTYRATDGCGHFTECTQLITVDDTTAPVITSCPDPVTVECPDEVPDPNVGLVDADDNCGTPVVTWEGDQSDGNTCPEVITRTYRATDSCGNFTECTQLITIDDTTPPLITCPDPDTVQCANQIPDPDTSLVTASDNCGTVYKSYVDEGLVPGADPPVMRRIYRATDACGNSSDCYHDITINDTTDPEIECPGADTVECADEVQPPDIGLVTASDNCGAVTVTWEGDESDGNSCPEVITRTYRATDEAGNWAECTQTIIIDDTTAPVITSCPEAVTVCPGQVPDADPDLVEAEDNCGDPIVTWEGDDSDGNTCPEVIVRTYRATDSCGNYVECTQTITVDDTIAPTWTLPGDGTIACDGDLVWGEPTDIADNCPPPTLEVASTDSVKDGGTTTYTRCWRLYDACMNEITGCQTIVRQCFDDLTVDKTDNVQDCVDIGESFTCTIDYSNPNEDQEATGVTVTDDLPVEAAYRNATHGGVYDSNQHRVTWDIGSLPASGSGAVEVTMEVTAEAVEGMMLADTCSIDCDQQVTASYAYEFTEVCIPPPCVEVWIDSLIAQPGEDIRVPIYIGPTDGYGIVGFDIQICWCPTPAGLLQFESCDPGEVVLDAGDWYAYCSLCEPGCVTLVGAGSTPLSGSGALMYINFHVSVNAKPGMCCDLTGTYVHLYDPEETLEVCWHGNPVCIDACEVEGWVKYWKCCPDGCGGYELIHPLPGAAVHLSDCNGPIETILTDVEGAYGFYNLAPPEPDCFYCLDVDHCNALEECITAYDASMVLQYLVHYDMLDDCPFDFAGGRLYPQRLAADVNCTGLITSEDGSTILRKVVGAIEEFPCPNLWRFYPLGGESCFQECPSEINWIGVRMGDVTGCPDCPDGVLASRPPTRVSLGRSTSQGDLLEVPVRVDDAEGIFSAEIDLSFDRNRYSVAGVEPAGLAESFIAAHQTDPGRIRLAMAGSEALSGAGEIAVIRLAERSGDSRRSSSVLGLERVLFNEGVPGADLVGSGEPAEQRLELGPITPNPFAGATEIAYAVPEAAELKLVVYNVEGQAVRTLVDRRMESGVHSVTWDGMDDSGLPVARGVYFCRLESPGGVVTRKMLLLSR